MSKNFAHFIVEHFPLICRLPMIEQICFLLLFLSVCPFVAVLLTVCLISIVFYRGWNGFPSLSSFVQFSVVLWTKWKSLFKVILLNIFLITLCTYKTYALLPAVFKALSESFLDEKANEIKLLVLLYNSEFSNHMLHNRIHTY